MPTDVNIAGRGTDVNIVGASGQYLTLFMGTSTGSANAQTLSALTSYNSGAIIEFVAGYTNTGAMTLNGKAVQLSGVALAANQVIAGEQLRLRYDGTAFQLLRQSAYLPAHFGVGARVRFVQVLNAGSGDVDVYTAPSGFRGAITTLCLVNPTGGTLSWYPQLKRSGTYYRTGATAAVGTLATGANTNDLPIFENSATTDTFAINTTGAGFTILAEIIEFPVSAGLKSAILLGLANGNNTILTATKPTKMVGSGSLALGLTSNTVMFRYCNSSGGARTIYWNLVKSGGTVIAPGSAGSNAIAGATSSVANLATYATSATLTGTLEVGDFVNVNTNANTDTQIAYVTYFEFGA